MLAHTLRLRSKDVRYLTKKRNYFVKGLFGFFYTKQYASQHFNQFSCHITIKLSKHATKRNIVKRRVMNILRDKQSPLVAIGQQFYKVFIMLNKNELAPLQTLLQSSNHSSSHHSSFNRSALIDYINQAFEESFTSFHSFLCSRK
jgi:ribonuclease P protein component